MDQHIQTLLRRKHIKGLAIDSRKVQKDFAFIAYQGSRIDGKNYIPEALSRGATAIVSDADVSVPRHVTAMVIPEAQSLVSPLAEAFYGYPSKNMTMIGVTGTNGKTTVSYMVQKIFQQAQKAVGRLGTIDYDLGHRKIPAMTTTPDPISVSHMLAELYARGTKAVVMEVSSHAIDQDRVCGIDFDYGILTNITRDHLDYHHSQDQYIATKGRFFTQLKKDATAILNADDPSVALFQDRIQARQRWYALHKDADCRAHEIKRDRYGSSWSCRYHDGDVPCCLTIPGSFNIANALAAFLVCSLEGVSPEVISAALRDFSGAPGRCEMLATEHCAGVMIDYAHTEDALKRVFEVCRAQARGRLIVVFGCGGDRDPGKRAAMGCAADQYADVAILTNDNPRSEDPAAIIRDIEQGFSLNKAKVYVEMDRAVAIRQAICHAQKEDFVVIAGKGHESYQMVGISRMPFNDKQVALEVLRGLSDSV